MQAHAESTNTLVRCRNCGTPSYDPYCGTAECLQDLARGIVRRRAWAGRFLFLAVVVGGATGALFTFYQRQDWQDAVMRWAYEQQQYTLAVHVYTGTWGGMTWQQWSTVGALVSASLVALWAVLSAMASAKMHQVPRLKFAVHAEEEQSWGLLKILGMILVIPLVIGFFALLIGAAAGAAAGGHHDDDD